MEMKGQPERLFDVRLTHLHNYQFQNQASEENRPQGTSFLSDEPDPVGDNAGPPTPALLASAVGHCLSASLLETCRKARVPILSMETHARAVVRPNEEGYPRIARINVTLEPHLAEDHPRRERCEEIFQKYCTVSSSLKPAIDIQVRVQWTID